MAIAPLNKFLTIAVPVAPGIQELYKAPVGTSAIVLAAQVAHVGVGNTFPRVTFTVRRTSTATRTAGNIRDNRIANEIEIPPNDALILIDGRLVLERTALVSDSLLINGVQSGITTINDVKYHHPTGLTTVTTLDPHGFSEGDKITMAGIAFTCPSTAGITSNIFPAPQTSFTVERVGSAITFETNTGIVKTLPHTFQPSIHKFIRPVGVAITVVGNSNGNASVNDVIRPVSGTNYNSVTGILSVTSETPHNLAENDTISINNESLVFTCSQDNFFKEKRYPRSTDPASKSKSELNNGVLGVGSTSTNAFAVQVGLTTTGGLVGPLQMEFICSILENSST